MRTKCSYICISIFEQLKGRWRESVSLSAAPFCLVAYSCSPFIPAAFGQQKMPAQRHKQSLRFVLIALASAEVYKGIKKQQRIKHLFHTRREVNTYKRFSADCSFYYHYQ